MAELKRADGAAPPVEVVDNRTNIDPVLEIEAANDDGVEELGNEAELMEDAIDAPAQLSRSSSSSSLSSSSSSSPPLKRCAWSDERKTLGLL